MPSYKIDIISDLVCPWCPIGHSRLRRAIQLFTTTHPSGRHSSFSVRWHPFYLDPSAPAQSIPLRQRMIDKFGSEHRVDEMQARLARMGKGEGIVFSFEGRVGRTRDGHRLVELAARKDDDGGEDEDVQGKLMAGLFKGYFEEGADVTDLAWIERVGRESGLAEKFLEEWRERDGGGVVVDAEAERNRGLTSGVPRFTVNGRYVIEGAQDPEEFYRVFAEIADGEEVGQVSGVNSC